MWLCGMPAMMHVSPVWHQWTCAVVLSFQQSLQMKLWKVQWWWMDLNIPFDIIFCVGRWGGGKVWLKRIANFPISTEDQFTSLFPPCSFGSFCFHGCRGFNTLIGNQLILANVFLQIHMGRPSRQRESAVKWHRLVTVEKTSERHLMFLP